MRNSARFFGLVLGALAGLAGIQASHGSARMQVDEAKGVIRFVAKLHYFGPALTPELATASTDEIRRMWNESNAEVFWRGRMYRTEFEITQVIGQAATPELRKDCANNFVEIANPAHAGDRSYYYLWGQDGRFYTSDELGTSTTAAHEFGHGLGLEHNDLDQRAAPVPGIMFARGTWVRPEFQWDPAAAAGAPGGSVRPHYRKVRVEDVRALGLMGIQLDAMGVGCVGGKQFKSRKIVD